MDGSAALHSDGAAKHGHNRLAICHSYSLDGAGGGEPSPPHTAPPACHAIALYSPNLIAQSGRVAARQTRALAIVDLLGGTREDEAEAIRLTFQHIADTYNLLQHEKGVTGQDITADTLMKKYGSTQTDSAATQQKTNRLCGAIIALAHIADSDTVLSGASNNVSCYC